jgi:acetoin utilization deacetylase AcuC-like enzyme
MILNRPGRGSPLSDFGISIPSSPDRGKRILQVLREHEILGPLEEKWLLGDDGVQITKEDVLRTHSPEYVEKLFSDKVEEVMIQVYELIDSDGNYHRYDPSKAAKPLSGMFDRSLRGLAGTYQVCRVAASTGFCFNLSGGGHHAHRDFGHGFCVLNDIMIALHKMQAEKLATNIWIIDVDVHKGDGVASITQDDSTITTLSVHMARGWPLDIPEFDAAGNRHPSYTPSDIDVPIESGEEPLYNRKLKEALDELSKYPLPDLAFVQLGADPYEKDGLPSTALMKLTLEQMNERNALIYRFIEDRSIPAAYIMSGGYGEHAWEPYPDFLIRALLDRLA